MTVNWTDQTLEQLTFHWQGHVRPHLEGLTDDEYFWQPAPGCWSVRPRGEARTTMAAGGGQWVIDVEIPEPVPTPVTTIAWRLAHVIVGVFGMRNASHFGGPPVDYQSFHYAPDASTALAQLDEAYGTWTAGVASLDPAGMARAVGPAEGPFAASPYAALVLHIHREAIHHLAEVLLLRDLHRRRVTE